MDWMVYLKTTETCNLNCRHCYTNGINGPKIFWDVDKRINWIKQLYTSVVGPDDTIHFEFHGGEPFLAPIEDFVRVHRECQGLHPNTSWGATSNLVFKLTDQIVDFIRGPLNNRIGTSWDPDIRFANEKQRMLWQNNVKYLIKSGVTVKLFISVTQSTLDIEPIELLQWVKDLGIHELAFERLTPNGNAKIYPDIFPSNIQQDKWFLTMHEQVVQHNARDWVDNEFLETIYNKFETGFTRGGTFCRDCEEKIFTVNADGAISGCPNSAPEFSYGFVDDDINTIINNPIRNEVIACERSRNPLCYDCNVFQYCGGDCHQLEWQNGVCGAPKSLMQHLAGKSRKTIWLSKG